MNIRIPQLGCSNVYVPINDGNGYSLAGIPLRPRLIQVVVREIRLVCRGDRIICLSWSGWERGDTSGDDESGSGGSPHAPTPTRTTSRAHCFHHCLISHRLSASIDKQTTATSATRHLHEYQDRKIRVPRNTMGPLQAYDHLFTLTSVSKDRSVTADQQIWVWARPIGRAHTHQLRNAPRQPRSVGSAASTAATSSRVGE